MPFRDTEHRAKVQFQTSLAMPYLITKAAERVGKRSNTQYIQHVLVAALARDLGLDEQELLAELPPTKRDRPAFMDDGTRHSAPRTREHQPD